MAGSCSSLSACSLSARFPWSPRRRVLTKESLAAQESGRVQSPFLGGDVRPGSHDGSQACGTGTAWLVRRYRAPIDTLMSLDLTFQLYSEQASSVNNWQVVADQFEVIGYTDTVAGWQQYRFQRLQLTGQWPPACMSLSASRRPGSTPRSTTWTT
jgi:hypothetical protein